MKFQNLLPLLPAIVMLAGCGASATNTTGDSNSTPADTNTPLKDTYKTTDPSSLPSDPSLEIPKFEKPKDGTEVAVITTKFGKIIFKFRNDKAPKHCENFIKLAKKGFYDKTLFHRIIPDFMIQGGDPETKGTDTMKYGSGGPGYNVKNEFNNLAHLRGVVSMARSQDVDSAGSQFFVCVADSANVQNLNKQYTAFGEVVSGMDVADQIVAQPRDGNDLPNERIEMTVKIEKWPVK